MSAAGLEIRATTAEDGATLAAVVRAAGTLEPLTEYAYVMLADQLGETCALALLDGEPAGCVIAFREPRRPQALFVWQIGVHPRGRRRGLAHAMLDAILARPGLAGVREVHATVAPSNAASSAMFAAYAARRGARHEVGEGYTASLFASAHEPERLIRITGLSTASLERAVPVASR